MADENDTQLSAAAKRREQRRNKILENAEQRKQKIFGITASNGIPIEEEQISLENIPSEQIVSEEVIATNPSSEIDENHSIISGTDHNSITGSDVAKLSEFLRSLPDPLKDDHLMQQFLSTTQQQDNQPTNHKSEKTFEVSPKPTSPTLLSGNRLVFNRDSRSASSPPTFDAFKFMSNPAAPCVLAFVVCFLLRINLGIFVSHSLVVPFILYEMHQCILIYSKQNGAGEANLIETALVLSGVKKEVIVKCVWMFKLLKKLVEDFSIYFSVLVVWHILVGFTDDQVLV